MKDYRTFFSRIIVAFCLLLLAFNQIQAQETEVLYLSGTGSDNTVNWQFYCTDGRNSGKWTTIPVPSNWELQGFGKYNYGLDKDPVRGMEKGLYKYTFKAPAQWKDKTVRIIFEGSMTDTEVKINGQSAGPTHQGSFYRFKYDVTQLLNYGKNNLLEVTVAKHSANESVNRAERRGDFWIFGGIFRPVFLEAIPKQFIDRIALNAKANGHFEADVFTAGIDGADEVTAQIYSIDGTKFGKAFNAKVSQGGSVVRVQTNVSSPRLWTPEFPNLYQVEFTLLQKGKPVHTVKQRFGFRTVELRQRDGIYVNGVKIKFRGVNRHSFWPTSGRTTNKDQSVKDVQLMKDMNMNAVRMSHYPPDEHFLEACDSLGLFVMDELAGWHWHYDTKTGAKLVEEMMARDINHPSVILWSNGNEGGHNYELDAVFHALDIQKRPLIHPWEVFRGTDTQHYINYDYGNGTHLHGHDVVFPTEFLHGLYDGGHGAGLEDYWELMWRHPRSAGGFLWVFADEGVVRRDKNGIIDTDGDHGADGILGPYHEKEGSYFTIKEVWSPVFIERREITPAFDGTFRLENRFFYTNINQCSFAWKLAQMPNPYGKEKPLSKTGTAAAPNIIPGEHGKLTLQLPSNWQDYDVLYLTAHDPHQREIFTWSWPLCHPDQIAKKLAATQGSASVNIKETDTLYNVEANGIHLSFDRKTGLLRQVQNGKGVIPFGNGPVLSEGDADFENPSYRYEGKNLVVESKFSKKSSFRSLVWTIYPSGWLKMEAKYFPKDYESTLIGLNFSYPEKMVKGVQWMGNGPYRVWKNRLKGTTLGIWEKPYNNTITGLDYVYPEFKGYYSNLYWLKLITTNQPITILCSSEDVFLRLYTPQWPEKVYNTAPPFPEGDISFMHGISPIGTKSQKAENMGPMGRKNMYFDYWKDEKYTKEIKLFFDFSGR